MDKQKCLETAAVKKKYIYIIDRRGIVWEAEIGLEGGKVGWVLTGAGIPPPTMLHLI